jgi:aldehyde dehydrogenase (NAD+)/aldehyde dehydrogenase
MELIGDVLPAGVLNIITGFGNEAGAALATSDRIAKLSFTGSTELDVSIITRPKILFR